MLAEEVSKSLYEFFVVYIHAIAYVCHVYPTSSFKLVRQYGTATYENRHPGVRRWVENAAQSVMKLVYSATDDAKAIVSIVVLENSQPIERFGVQIGEFITDAENQTTSVDETDIAEQYRGCITKLLNSPREPETDSDRSMSMLFEGNIDPTKNEELIDWIPGEADREKAKPAIRAIRSVTVGGGNDTVLVMNLFRQSSSQD